MAAMAAAAGVPSLGGGLGEEAGETKETKETQEPRGGAAADAHIASVNSDTFTACASFDGPRKG
jgi:hypothetical protein